MAMAIPPSDMMFEEMPAPCMNENAPSTASGSGIVTTRIDAEVPEKKKCGERYEDDLFDERVLQRCRQRDR